MYSKQSGRAPRYSSVEEQKTGKQKILKRFNTVFDDPNLIGAPPGARFNPHAIRAGRCQDIIKIHGDKDTARQIGGWSANETMNKYYLDIHDLEYAMPGELYSINQIREWAVS
ncbi:hypothetical protein PCE1_000325 [Barthelona sp. PCE]